MMNNPKEMKELIKPTMIAQRYLGMPIKKTGNKLWYKSPFRNERTPSFMVDNEKGFHDFGDSWHGDIIDFVGKYYNTDYNTALKIISSDFNLPSSEKMSQDMKNYLKKKRDEELAIKIAIDKWFNKTLCKLCDELKEWQRIIQVLSKTQSEALAIVYAKEQYLDYFIDVFIDASKDDNKKIELYRDRRKI